MKSFFSLFSTVYSHVSGAISSDQHGFMKGRSTVSNLVCKAQFLCESLDRGNQVDVIYTDLSKAFDRLDHSILISKLDNFGFSYPLLRLTQSYLQDRHQFVQYRGYKSISFWQKSGVPQGSILGPLFFVMFINDILEGFDNNIHFLLYADDLKIYRLVDSVDDCVNLQYCLNRINTWCKDNYLPLNASKCNVMSFGRKSNMYMFNYNVDNESLQRPDFIKDLGVYFDPKLSFNKHVEMTTASAFRSLGFVIRNCKGFTNIATLRLLYVTFVRSRLEYASIVWSPIYNFNILQLEKIQRRFLKSAVYTLNGVYPPRGFPQSELLEMFNLVSLSNRRTTYFIIFLFKIVNNCLDCISLSSKINYIVPRINARHNHVFAGRTPRTNILIASPLHQMYASYAKIEHMVDIFFCSETTIRKSVLDINIS